MNMQQAIEEYLSWKATYAPVAADRYRVRLLHFRDFFGETKVLSGITSNEVIAYQQAMINSGKYSPATVAYAVRIIKNFFEFWQGRGETVPNPKELITQRYVSPKREVVELDDLNAMLEVLEENLLGDLKKKLAFLILWDTGMRVSELCDLNIEDLRQRKKGNYYVVHVRSRKTMDYNIVVWGEETDRVLRKYLAIRLSIQTNSDALFVSSERADAKRLSSRAVQRWVKEITDRAGIDKDITPHSFRHGKAHYMLDNGANVRDVQAVLRHVNPQSSFHYMKLHANKYIEVAGKHLGKPEELNYIHSPFVADLAGGEV